MIEGGINPDMKLLELEFENSSALDTALVIKVTELLIGTINKIGSASLVVSGGRTPLA
ncbi:MAG: hypothetical protein HN910_05930, partial [Porticoccaceae bacterium]|nr:hypothetical protein [Porticoccaceae bacterium]